MPNTLGHIGVQGVVTRLVFRDADSRWLLTGCILPDLPWIFQRAAVAAVPSLDLIDLRLYCVGQATLAGGLLLAGVLAALSRRPRVVFGVLGLNVILHLLLDACQRKWGGGVHLLAPLSWQDLRIGLF